MKLHSIIRKLFPSRKGSTFVILTERDKWIYNKRIGTFDTVYTKFQEKNIFNSDTEAAEKATELNNLKDIRGNFIYRGITIKTIK